MDVAFTDGTIAVKERYLLKDKLLRMSESNAEDAFRMLKESGFGSSATADGYEELIRADVNETDAFIREYAPTEEVKAYFLAPRDFHNAKAFVKAKFLGTEPDFMLAPEGLLPTDKIKEAVYGGDYAFLPAELADAVAQAESYLGGEEPEIKAGSAVGAIFVRAEYAYLKRKCYRNPALKALLSAQADMTNLLTLRRSGAGAEDGSAAGELVSGGNLDEGQLLAVLSGGENAYGYEEFVSLLSSPSGLGAAENYRDSYPVRYLAENKYELKADQPFLYYVLRRRVENADVRIIFACLTNGFGEREIKARLRSGKAGL